MKKTYQFEHRIMQSVMFVLGVAAVGIGTMVFLTGVQFVQLTESIFNWATGQSIPLDPIVISPSIDSEIRFYAVFWLSYGILLLWVARNILLQIQLVPILMGLFFMGGIGRILSQIFVGTPHPAFIILMVVELAMPILVAICYVRISMHWTD